MINEWQHDFDNNGTPDDLNNNGSIETNAIVAVILVSTDKTVSELQRNLGITNH